MCKLAGTIVDTGRKTVCALVVDDSPVAVRSICSVLSDLAAFLVVGTAGDGREALERAAALQPDLVLLDVQMPVMSGLEAVPLLKRSLPGIRVVMVAADDTPEVRHACSESGAHAFVPKEHMDRELPSLLLHMFNLN
jgi:CheY-like chemotaxis protein